jgi:hypothetical protein
LGRHERADNDKPWKDMNLDEQAVLIRQISGAVSVCGIHHPAVVHRS